MLRTVPRAAADLLGGLVLLAQGSCMTGDKPAPLATGYARTFVEPIGVLPSGDTVTAYTLTNTNRVSLRVMNYGGIVMSVRTPDRDGTLADVVLGYDDLAGYLKSTPYFGAIVGRYANRIARGQFALDGVTYRLAANNGVNTLHGGLRGFDKVLWKAEPFDSLDRLGLVLTYLSRDGEEGYPGTLSATVTYTLTDRNEFIIDYSATTDKATPVNLTQHSYWNLAGDGSGTVLDQQVTIDADAFTPVDTTLIPTGVLQPVDGTPFDLRRPTAIGARIDEPDAQLKTARGYDHNFVLRRTGDGLVHAARAVDPKSGRTLDVFTTEPGMQFYTGNFLDGKITGKKGHVYGFRNGFCFETQHFPDSPNRSSFPSTILRPGTTYRSQTVITFGVDGPANQPRALSAGSKFFVGVETR